VGDIITLLGLPASERPSIVAPLGDMRPTSAEVRQARPGVWRGTLIGTALGLLPGAGSVLASYTAYALERRLAGQSGQFGRGDVRGVSAPAAAAQAGVQSSFMPMLSFGLPLNAVMALMVGTMALKGLPPGPQVMSSHPEFFWGLIAVLVVIQMLLLCVHLPLLRLWLALLSLPYRFVFPVVTVVTCLGVYALRGSVYDLYLVAGLGGMGYVFHKLQCPLPPVLLGFILGPMMETHLRNMLQPAGEWRNLVTRPVSLSLLLVTVALIVFVLLPSVRRPREVAFRET
jgi:putative tricarboxylic transport membrane protein